MSRESFEKYLALERNYSVHTVRAYLGDLQEFADYCLEAHGENDLEDLPYTFIRSWIIALMEAGLTGRTINRKTAALKSYYKYQVRIGRIQTSPLAGHRPVRSARKVEVPFSVEEMRRLLADWPPAETYEDLRDQLMIELLYTTGMRRAELIGLTLADLDRGRGTLKVLGKRNKERLLPLLSELLPRIDRYLEVRAAEFPDGPDPHFFLTASGNKVYDTLVYRIINRYLSMVSAKTKKSPHILRHTFATHLLNQGADMNSVKELLGHTSLASTQVYTHNSIAELKRIHGSAHPRNLDKH